MAIDEEEPIDQASNAPRERPKALPAAKKLHDDAPDGQPAPTGSKAHGPVVDQGEEKGNISPEEDLIEQPAVVRRDGLKALSMAKELSDTPEDSAKTKESEGTEENNKGSIMHNPENSEKQKAKWDSITTKILLQVCMDEIRNTGKPGIGFRNRRWKIVVDEFNKRAKKKYNHKQLKNRMDCLRTDWNTWKQLLGKETRLRWNLTTGTIEANATWWDAKIKDNAKYAKFRYHGLEFCEELKFIFGETGATNQSAWTPAVDIPFEDSTSTAPPVESGDKNFNLEEDVSPVTSIQSKRKRMTSPETSTKMAKGNAKVGIAISMQKTLERLVAATENQNTASNAEIVAISPVHGPYSIPECIKVLDALNDEGKLDIDQYFYALELIRLDQSFRIVLICLSKQRDKLASWILYKYQLDKNFSN